MAQLRVFEFEERLRDWLPPAEEGCFRIWRSRRRADLCVLLARDHVHDYPPHMHDCVELVWIQSGTARMNCRGRSYLLQPGDVCLLAPNELHSTQNSLSQRCTFTLIHLPSHLYWSLAAVHTAAGTQLTPEPFRILRWHSINLCEFIGDFISCGTDEDRYRLAIPLLETIMFTRHSFAALRAEKAFWHPAVVHAREVMSDRLEEAVNINDMAAEVGLNARYFISLFKDGIGLPPHQYQIAMRVERARGSIQGLHSPLCEIAANAGFADQSHLNRHFKRSYGFTPGAFRRNLRFI